MSKPKHRLAWKLPAVTGTMLIGFCIAGLKGDPTTAPITTQATTAPVTQAVVVPPAVTVDSLIKQLGADDADARDAAQKQLVDLGSSVNPALKKAADTDPDPEVRSRAAAALAQLKDLEANGESFITLHMKDAPAADVLSAIGAQSHCQFLSFGNVIIPGRVNPTLSLDVDHKPFWDVMSDICGQMNVCPMINMQGTSTVQLIPNPRNWMAQSVHEVVGPFRVNVAGLYRTRSIDMLGPQQVEDQFSIRLMVLPEPKLAVTQMTGFVVKQARDDAGNSLMPKLMNGVADHMLRNARQMNQILDCRLSYPEQPGKKVAILRGEITVMLAQDVQQYQLDDVLGSPKTTTPLRGCKIQTNVIRQGTQMFRVTIQCTRDGATDDQWSVMTNHLGDINLQDAEGHGLTSFAGTMQFIPGVDQASFTCTCTFMRTGNAAIAAGALGKPIIVVGDPTRLIWNVATSVKPRVIPVTFKDLPMP